VTEKLRLLGPPLARGRPFKWLHYVTEPRGSRRCLLRLYDGLEEGRGSCSLNTLSPDMSALVADEEHLRH
jgi:hypothetical protein